MISERTSLLAVFAARQHQLKTDKKAYHRMVYYRHRDYQTRRRKEWGLRNPERIKEHQKKYSEVRRVRKGMLTKDEYLRTVRVSPERKRNTHAAAMKRYQQKRRANGLHALPRRRLWKEKWPAVYRLEMFRRRREYVSWWRRALHAQQIAQWRALGQRRLTTRIRAALKRRMENKILTRTVDMLGCSIAHFRDHMSAQFKRGMSWENYGKVWSIDHKIPLAKFDLNNPDHRKIACHYTNLQPLSLMDNSVKQDFILPQHAQPCLPIPA